MWWRRRYVFMSSARSCMRPYGFSPSLRPFGMWFLRYLWSALMYFLQTFVASAFLDRNELISFWGQTVKGQGHSMTKYDKKYDFRVSERAEAYRAARRRLCVELCLVKNKYHSLNRKVMCKSMLQNHFRLLRDIYILLYIMTCYANET